MVFSFFLKTLKMFLFITIPVALGVAFLSKTPSFHLAVIVLETGLNSLRQLFLSPNLIRIKFCIIHILCWFLDFFTSSTNVYLQLPFSREETSTNGSGHSDQASSVPTMHSKWMVPNEYSGQRQLPKLHEAPCAVLCTENKVSVTLHYPHFSSRGIVSFQRNEISCWTVPLEN